ncbi:MAG TPA: DUF1648 domain-containing protein [Nocardioides sp.]|nr:DUF1648 domain-containing protein [Nocardioides sp.]
MASSGGARGALLFVAGAAAFVASLVVAGNEFPRRVPIHFDLSGDPDQYLARADALVLMSIVALAGGLVFGLLGAGATRIPVRMFNVPERDWWAATPEREAELRRRMRTDMYGFGGVFLLFLAGLTLLTLRASRMADPHLDGWFVALLVGFAVVVVGWVVFLVRVRYRRTD